MLERPRGNERDRPALNPPIGRDSEDRADGNGEHAGRRSHMIILGAGIARELALEAQRCVPYEACGLLLESASQAVRRGALARIEHWRRIANTSSRPDRFAFEPLEFVRRERAARGAGLNIAGIYHSHPNGPALPSREDGRSARLLWGTSRSWVYLILGRAGSGRPSCRAWRLIDGHWQESACGNESRGRVGSLEASRSGS